MPNIKELMNISSDEAVAKFVRKKFGSRKAGNKPPSTSEIVDGFTGYFISFGYVVSIEIVGRSMLGIVWVPGDSECITMDLADLNPTFRNDLHDELSMVTTCC